MTSSMRPRGLGYESPTQNTVSSALAAHQLTHRLNELHEHKANGDEGSRQHATMDEVASRPDKLGGKATVSIKDRIACFQWTWFTSTMATGGIANVLASGEWIWPPPLANHSANRSLVYLQSPFRRNGLKPSDWSSSSSTSVCLSLTPPCSSQDFTCAREV